MATSDGVCYIKKKKKRGGERASGEGKRGGERGGERGVKGAVYREKEIDIKYDGISKRSRHG